MHTFGLTGGIASGKSFVGKLFASWGVPTIDADQVAREVVEPGSDGLNEIVREFGEGVLQADGTLDRKKLAGLMFGNADVLKKVNKIVHPRVAMATSAHLLALTEKGHKLACYEATLLVENGVADAFRPLVVVTAPLDVRVARAMSRDNAKESEVRARILAQMPDEEKVAKADIVIINDSNLETLEQRAREALDQVRVRVG